MQCAEGGRAGTREECAAAVAAEVHVLVGLEETLINC